MLHAAKRARLRGRLSSNVRPHHTHAMDLARLQPLPLAIGAAVWAVALLVIWVRPERDRMQMLGEDFARWKAVQGRPDATLAEFLGSEEAPRNYLSRRSLTVVVSAIALLALHAALRSWSVLP